MIQRIVQVLLLIALVGQNFLSPALAVHDLLHTIKTTGGEVRLISPGASSAISSVSSFDSSTALTSSFLDPNSVYPSALNQSLADFSAFKCAEACTMLASGHCVSHCVSLTGIFIEPSLTKYRPGKSPQNHVTLWSAQTTDSLSINRPPIV